MTRFILNLLMLITVSTAFSQRQYFIYLQSEPGQPFFVKVNERIHSSSPSGYLILSKLRDSSYTFSVGFPQNNSPEQKFTVDVKAKDHGYTLRNFSEKGWGLYDLQTMNIQMGMLTNTTPPKPEQKEVSVFTDILSKAANDPSLKEKPAANQPAVAKDDTKPVVEQLIVKKEEPPVTTKDEPKKEEKKLAPVEEYKRSAVTKSAETLTPEGISITFIDDYGSGKKDTIRIIIPDQKVNVTETKEPPKAEKKFLDIATGDTVKKTEPAVKAIKIGDLPGTPPAKNNCSSLASESDFLKLRKKMAAETRDDGMIDEAKKQFKTKCFAVSQIKNLSALFLNDNGKYKFFDAAYIHVSDPDKFSSLVSELKDEYYINRFKAMLH